MKKIIFLSFAALLFSAAVNAQTTDTTGKKDTTTKKDSTSSNGFAQLHKSATPATASFSQSAPVAATEVATTEKLRRKED